MKICYIKEEKDTCDIIKKIILILKRFFNILNLEEQDKKIFLFLPITKNTKVNKHKIIKLTKKINQKLYKEDIEKVVLSQYLESVEDIKIRLHCENIDVLNGRYLFKCLSYKVIEYIFNKQNIKMELQRRSNSIVK